MFTRAGYRIGTAEAALSTAGPQRKDTGPSTASTAESDTVELTSGARLLERREKSLASLRVADRARIEDAKTAIANGDYRVDAGRIADAMLRVDRKFGAGHATTEPRDDHLQPRRGVTTAAPLTRTRTDRC